MLIISIKIYHNTYFRQCVNIQIIHQLHAIFIIGDIESFLQNIYIYTFHLSIILIINVVNSAQ